MLASSKLFMLIVTAMLAPSGPEGDFVTANLTLGPYHTKEECVRDTEAAMNMAQATLAKAPVFRIITTCTVIAPDSLIEPFRPETKES